MSEETQGGDQPPPTGNVHRLERTKSRPSRPAAAASESIDLRTRRAMRGLPEKCPWIPLGFDGDRHWLIQQSGYVRGYVPRDLQSRVTMLSICGSVDWLKDCYPKADRNGKPVNGFANDIAVEQLTKACQAMGPWSRDDSLRGVGAWPGREKGELVLHRGNHVILNRYKKPVGRYGDYVYEPDAALPDFMSDTGKAMAETAAGEIYNRLCTFNFSRGTFDAFLMLGFICCAILGGALKFRPHLSCTGEPGVGKSELIRLVRLLLGKALIWVTNATPAGIWQAIQQRSLPVFYDEAEPHGESQALQGMVELARQSTTGANVLRGSSQQGAAAYKVQSCFALFSVVPPKLMAQDVGRFLTLRIEPNAARVPDLDEDWAARAGEGLMHRLVSQFKLFACEVQPAFRDAFRQAGYSDRLADLYSHTFAAVAVLHHDTVEAALDELNWTFLGETSDSPEASYLRAMKLRTQQDSRSTYWQCIDYLLGARTDRQKLDSETLGELAERSALPILELVLADQPRSLEGLMQKYGNQDGDERFNDDYSQANDARVRLLSFGVRITLETTEEGELMPVMMIALQHRVLAELFQGTVWSAVAESPHTGWGQVLQRFPGARLSKSRKAFRRGIYSRAVLLPLVEVLRPLDRPEPRGNPDPPLFEDTERPVIH